MDDRPTVEDLQAAEAAARALEAELNPNVENNRQLTRHATAQSAVNVVMVEQLGLAHPTLLSAWTVLEINRLLDVLYADPGGEIRLGGQALGDGFVKPEPKAKQAQWPERIDELRSSMHTALEEDELRRKAAKEAAARALSLPRIDDAHRNDQPTR